MSVERLLKPSRLDRQVAKFERRKRQARAKLDARRDEMKRNAEIRRQTYLRDKGCCRAFGTPLKLVSDNPFDIAHAHHFVYASAGGSDDMHNRITLSPKAHQMEHDALLKIEGSPDSTLFFTQFDLKGQIVKTWESPVPR